MSSHCLCLRYEGLETVEPPLLVSSIKFLTADRGSCYFDDTCLPAFECDGLKKEGKNGWALRDLPFLWLTTERDKVGLQ